ncbi:hypothetical protein Glove_374g45 [Diversispora epigaea]|uniref:Uncharacterized protein n=1 Tax=Diversispora epigaea TaxID=1348612 RepID=A0A397H5E8_9GLOM|nr:hypothetical protein Glove_374g45 [Diversispora epigaea]
MIEWKQASSIKRKTKLPKKYYDFEQFRISIWGLRLRFKRDMETQTARRAFCIESGIIDIETYLISSSSWIPCKSNPISIHKVYLTYHKHKLIFIDSASSIKRKTKLPKKYYDFEQFRISIWGLRLRFKRDMETQTARRAFCIESGIIDIETYLISSSSWIPCKSNPISIHKVYLTKILTQMETICHNEIKTTKGKEKFERYLKLAEGGNHE